MTTQKPIEEYFVLRGTPISGPNENNQWPDDSPKHGMYRVEIESAWRFFSKKEAENATAQLKALRDHIFNSNKSIIKKENWKKDQVFYFLSAYLGITIETIRNRFLELALLANKESNKRKLPDGEEKECWVNDWKQISLLLQELCCQENPLQDKDSHVIILNKEDWKVLHDVLNRSPRDIPALRALMCNSGST